MPNGKLPHKKVVLVSIYLSPSALTYSVLQSREILVQLGSMLGKRSKRTISFSWHFLATNSFPTIEEQVSNFRRKGVAKVLYNGLFMSEILQTNVKASSKI